MPNRVVAVIEQFAKEQWQPEMNHNSLNFEWSPGIVINKILVEEAIVDDAHEDNKEGDDEIDSSDGSNNKPHTMTTQVPKGTTATTTTTMMTMTTPAITMTTITQITSEWRHTDMTTAPMATAMKKWFEDTDGTSGDDKSKNESNIGTDKLTNPEADSGKQQDRYRPTEAIQP